MVRELEQVVLSEDLPECGLKAGDIGTVVLVHSSGKGYEVEFMTLDGNTVAVVSVFPAQIRSIRQYEIAHARALEGEYILLSVNQEM